MNDEYVNAYGYGIIDNEFKQFALNNPYKDDGILIARFKNNGTYSTGVINATHANADTKYIRFLTKNEAQNYINSVAGVNASNYTIYKAKTQKILKLIDPSYNMYASGFELPAGVQPDEYNQNGEFVSKTDTSSTDYLVNAFKKLIGRYKKFYIFYDNPLAKFLGFDKTDTYGEGVYTLIDVKPDDDNLLFDIKYKLSYRLHSIEEPTLHKSLDDVNRDFEFGHTESTLKAIDPDLSINVSDKLSITLKLSIKYINNMIDVLWNKKSNITGVLERIITGNFENDIFSMVNIADKSSTGFQDLITFKDKIEKAKNKLFEFIRLAYEGTEDIVESCTDKDVTTILHELYDEKI